MDSISNKLITNTAAVAPVKPATVAKAKNVLVWHDPVKNIFWRYVGNIENGREHGMGKRSGSNGDYFIGIFNNGKFQTGLMRQTTTHCLYEGEFHNFLWHGECTVKFCSGESFVGMLENGGERVKGRYTYEDGSSLEAEFCRGKHIETEAKSDK